MNKILLALLFISFSSLEAKMIDGIALVVEGEAVTTAEIRAVQTQMGVDKKQAIDLLIQDRLQKAAMKNISIDETSIDAKIENIAKQNHVSIPKMQKILKESGTPWIQYRSSIKEALQKEKFFQDTVLSSIPSPTEDELKFYYEAHRNEFKLPSRINLVEYSAKNKSSIEKFLKTNKKSLVKSRRIQKQTNKTNEALLATLLSTPNGQYTTPLNTGQSYIVYKVLSKTGSIPMPYAMAQNAIAARIRESQQAHALNDYFEKLRTRADIQILRQ